MCGDRRLSVLMLAEIARTAGRLPGAPQQEQSCWIRAGVTDWSEKLDSFILSNAVRCYLVVLRNARQFQ